MNPSTGIFGVEMANFVRGEKTDEDQAAWLLMLFEKAKGIKNWRCNIAERENLAREIYET